MTEMRVTKKEKRHSPGWKWAGELERDVSNLLKVKIVSEFKQIAHMAIYYIFLQLFSELEVY